MQKTIKKALVVFQGKNIRRVWHEDEWYFSVVDIVGALTESPTPRQYWGKLKDREFVQEELNKRFDQLLEDEPSAFDDEYGEFMNSIKTTLFLGDWIEEKDEDFLMEKYDIRPGEIRAKLEKTDWLLYAAQEIAKITQHRIAIRELEKLRLRVQDGVREELLVLLKLKGIGRIRARRLYGNGIKDLGDIKKVDLATLGQILGKAIAEDVKKQVGEEVKEVPAGKRKGQLGLGKF